MITTYNITYIIRYAQLLRTGCNRGLQTYAGKWEGKQYSTHQLKKNKLFDIATLPLSVLK